MARKQFILVTEGESEVAYLKRLQSFLNKQSSFGSGLHLIIPAGGLVRTGAYGKLVAAYRKARQINRKGEIRVWADFDLYIRNDLNCGVLYKKKPVGIPDFLFSFHNFEDFLALHLENLEEWETFGNRGHFDNPLHAVDYQPEMRNVLKRGAGIDYQKGEIALDFISWAALKNLKKNLCKQPRKELSGVAKVDSFAEFLVLQLDECYPEEMAS